MTPPTHGMDSQSEVLYFFLSYARLAPLTEVSATPRVPRLLTAQSDTGSSDAILDPDVRKFFDDLDGEIARLTRRNTASGFYDRHIPFAVDPCDALSHALSRAQVFLSLHSPSYLRNSWPRRERNAFRIRMIDQGHDPDARMLPVLWTPIPSWTVRPADLRQYDQANALALDLPEYRENGLRALCVLRHYEDVYRQVLDRIAARIIQLVETTVVPQSQALDLDRLPEIATDDPSFILTVLTDALESDPLSPWHPYRGRQGVPIADYALRTAERFGFAPQVVDCEEFADRSARNPALALVDPRILRRGDGMERLCRFFQGLPVWASPLVIGDEDDATVDGLAAHAQEMLSSAPPVAPGPSPNRVVERVDGPRDLEQTLVSALTKTRQAYLRHGFYDCLPPLASRPRLSGGDSSSTCG